MIRLLSMALALASTAVPVVGQAPASAASPPASASSRLAVISATEAADFGTLVTAELSGNPAVSLVERDDLAKIGDELKVQAMASTHAAALGKLLNAQGLLFIDKGAGGYHAKFTAAGLGFVLFDLEIAADLNLPVQAKSLGNRVASLVSKLNLPPDKAIPLSVLNLRLDRTSQEPERLEREITLLLESRLAAVPEYVILERRHADALGFEHSLLVPTAPDLLKGAYLLDGSIQVPTPSQDDLTVSLRIRSPKIEQEITFQVQGTSKDLRGFVDALANKINEKIGAPVTNPIWSPATEAREYLQEGIWGWEHRDPRDALEALDSASMLGEEASDLLALRAEVLCQLASQDAYFYGGKTIQPPPMSVPDRLYFLHRAWADLKLYRDGDGEEKLQIFNPKPDPDVRLGKIDGDVVDLAAILLSELEAGHSDPLTESLLRQEIRTWCNFDPLQGKAPRVPNPDDLCESIGEEFAYYHLQSSDAASKLSVISPEKFCKRFSKTPEEQKASFDRFVQELLSDSKTHLYGLLLLCRDPNPETREKAYTQFIDEFWARRDELMAAHRFPVYSMRAAFLPEDMRKKHTSQTVPLLRYFLSKMDNVASGNNNEVFRYLWQPKWFSAAEARDIWTDFQAMRSRAATAQPQDGSYHSQVQSDLCAAEFLAVFPQFQQSPASPAGQAPLTVDHYWKPSLKTGQPLNDFHMFEIISSADGVWVLGGENADNAGIYQVRLPDFETTFLPTECGSRPYNMAATSNAIYVTYGEYPAGGGPLQTFLKRYDLAAKTWATRQIANITVDGLYAIKDQLYFNLWTVIGKTQEGGLARYDWDKNETTLLASSRRRPAQNQFDDRAGYQIHGLFLGPEGKLCVNADGGIYQVLDIPGAWPSLFDFPRDVAPVTQGRQTLVRSQGGEVVLLDADEPAPRPLMVPAQPVDWRKMPDKTLKKQLPGWASQALWTASPQWGWANIFGNPHYLGFHKGHLFALSAPTEQQKRFELLWFTEGKPDPVHIPLRLLIDSSEEKAFSKGFVIFPRSGSSNSTLTLLTTEKGICFHELRGFWFLSFEEIDTYLKSVEK